jgi:hypothetical protein
MNYSRMLVGRVVARGREAEPLPQEAWAMRGTASMPEALLRVRQWHITFCSLAKAGILNTKFN